MKRILCGFLLICSLLLGLVQPVLATETEEAPAVETATEETTQTIDSSQTEELTEELTEEEEALASENGPDSAATRSGSTYTTSEAGIAFISEMMGGSYSSSQLAEAERAVNTFITSKSLSLSQQQFDALVDFSMEYGGNMFTSGYQCERVIVSGNYTDAEFASAFCSWVKDGSGNFSQNKLNRRLRQIKLFLYESYDGVCQAGFRYVIYNGNGGSLNDNTVLCYTYGSTYGNLPTASRSGYYFAGWYTAASGGSHLCNSNSVTDNYTVYARWSSTEVTDPNESGSGGTDESGWPALPELKISEAGIQFIKDHEGFVAYPMWDYSQYTVGYGTRYDPENSPIPISIPITEEEADYLLRHMLADFEVVLDKQLDKSTVEHTQAQYDAMMSFTFNLGQQWINSNYKIYNYFLYGGYTEMEFVNTIGSWCRAGGSVLSGLARRRMDEANLYLNGDYTLNSKVYLCILFNGAKGEPDVGFRYYKTGTALGYLPGATREGYRLTGWYDKVSGGTEYTTATVASSGGILNLYAQWEEGQPDEDPPSPPIENPPGVFTDVPEDAWFYEPVMLAVEAGIFGGVSENQFMPNAPMSRAMLVTVLNRMDGGSTVETVAPFTDVPSGQWYSDAVNWAYEKGIVNGVTETTFGLNDNITRQQLTTMLYRYAQYCGHSTDQRGDLTAFSDASAVQSYALESMQWAVGCGIISGDNGKLDPTGSATRAQCAKMIMVFLNTYMQ